MKQNPHLPKWKNEQEKNRFKNQKNLILKFVLFFVTLIFLALIFRFYSGYKSSKIKDLHRVSFVIINEVPFFISLEKGKGLVIIKFPKDKLVQVSRGYGQYPISSIYGLGELEGKGEPLFLETLKIFFGLPAEGLIYVPRRVGEDLLTCSQTCLTKVLFSALKEESRTSFSKFDLVNLMWRAKLSSEFEVKKINLTGGRVEDEKGEFDFKKVINLFGRNFWDQEIVNENLTVAVFNASEVSGLGQQAARIITNIGGRIVNIGSAPYAEKTLILANPKSVNSYTLTVIKRLFGAEFRIEEEGSGWADISLYPGNDYWKIQNEKW